LIGICVSTRDFSGVSSTVNKHGHLVMGLLRGRDVVGIVFNTVVDDVVGNVNVLGSNPSPAVRGLLDCPLPKSSGELLLKNVAGDDS